MMSVPFHALVVDSLPANQVNNATKIVLHADGDLDGGGWHTKLGPNLVDDSPWVGTGSE